MKKTLLILLLICGCTLAGFAQSSRFHISGVFPTGDFGDDAMNLNKAGHAAFGFGLGFKHYSTLPVENLFWTIGIDAYYNGLQNDMKDYYEDHYKSADITFNKYINLPVTVGINYTLPVTDVFGLYGEFGLGPNLSWITPDKVKYKNSGEVTTTYKPAVGFAYGIEAGFVFKQKYTLGLKYFNLGSYRYKSTETQKVDGSKYKTKDKTNRQPISHITLILGIKF